MNERMRATGIVLGGGLSTRMGQDKASLRLGGLTLADRAVDFALGLFTEVVYVTNDPADPVARPGLRVARDEVPHLGPLGGIAAGLKTSSSEHSFVMACDMPFVNADLVRYLVSRAEEADVVVPVTDRPQTLHAVYSKRCRDIISSQLAEGDHRIRSLFDKVKVLRITEDEIRRFDERLLTFFNVNTAEEYREAVDIFEAGQEGGGRSLGD